MFGREKRELRRLLTTDGTTSHSQHNKTGNELTDISEFKPISRHSPLQTSHHRHPTKGLSESNPRIRRTLSASASNRQSTKTRSLAGTFELHQGTSATFRNISLIPMRPTPTSLSTTSCSNRFPTSGPVVSGNGLDSGERDCAGGGGGVNHVVTLPNLLLKPPEITFEEVLTAPSTPSNEQQPPDGGQVHFSVDGGSKLMLATGSPGSSMTGSSNHLQTNPNQQAVMVTPRGSLVTLCHSPLEFRESSYTVNYQDESDDGEEVCLMYTRHEKIPMKDFSAEIRASMDVENFLSQAQLLLDLQATSLEHIMDCLLHHLLDGEEVPTAFAEAKKILFTHNSVHQLSKTIQSTCRTYSGGFDYDQSWLCVLCNVPSVQKRNVAIARLKQPANLGRTSQEVWFIVLIITPTKEKGTKNALETGRTFSTLFADMDLRLRLLAARTEEDFKQLLWEHMKELAEERGSPERKLSKDSTSRKDDVCMPGKEKCCFAGGLRADLRRRLPYYWSDYKDGFVGHGTLRKTAATTVFLYFACILPAIALGVLNYDNTNGYIDVKKVIYSQTIGGIVFAVFGGQPMVILLTTAPLALYTKVIYHICQDWNLDFAAMFAWTGLWNSFFLLIYAVTDASRLMKWSTRSTEEIFALFMAITFTVDAFKDVVTDFKLNYHSTSCEKHVKTGGADFDVDDNASFPYRRRQNSTSLPSTFVAIAGMVVDEIVSSAVRRSTGQSTSSLSSTGDGQTAVTEADHTAQPQQPPIAECMRENSLLYLLLMLGTVWLSLSLYNFTKTPFLNANKRTLLADCALPVSVILMSFFGSYVFQDVKLEQFKLFSGDIFSRAPLWKLSWPAILGAMGLGFFLSLLFFMDQSISGAMVNSPENRLKKGPAYHWDLLVVALLNAVLTYFGLPMVHGALPHSPLHVRAMADVEDRVDQGHVYQRIIFVRETRVTGILCHVLIGLSLFCIDKLKLIPRPVLDGLFLYLAITALHHNQLFERIMLLVTEQAAYPPNHYIRTVPQRKVHLFTLLQLVQLVVLCAFGFAPLPYLKMVFPILLLLLLPTRHKVVPFLVEKKFLLSLDG